MDPHLRLFRRQYLQLFEPHFLSWPPKQLLKASDVQIWLFRNLFDSSVHPRLPPQRYQYRVLKQLLAKIEQSIEDPEEDEISDSLMSQLSMLVSSALPSELEAAQRKEYVTFTCVPPSTRNNTAVSDEDVAVTLLERRHLISGSNTTGFRTWEAALHLGSYLLGDAGSLEIRGKNILELGCGTGFLSVLCSKLLGAKHVTATDGDEGVIEAFKENLFLNDLDDGSTTANVLRWGRGLGGSWVEDECETYPYDVVLGADITYDKSAVSALVATLRMLLDLRPQLKIFISGAVRNAETFEGFRFACSRNHLQLEEIAFQAVPMREQFALFYATAVPLKIVLITRHSSNG